MHYVPLGVQPVTAGLEAAVQLPFGVW